MRSVDVVKGVGIHRVCGRDGEDSKEWKGRRVNGVGNERIQRMWGVVWMFECFGG